MEDNKFGWSFSLKFINVWSWKGGKSWRTSSHPAINGQELGSCQAAVMPSSVTLLWQLEDSTSTKPLLKRQKLNLKKKKKILPSFKHQLTRYPLIKVCSKWHCAKELFQDQNPLNY